MEHYRTVLDDAYTSSQLLYTYTSEDIVGVVVRSPEGQGASARGRSKGCADGAIVTAPTSPKASTSPTKRSHRRSQKPHQ